MYTSYRPNAYIIVSQWVVQRGLMLRECMVYSTLMVLKGYLKATFPLLLFTIPNPQPTTEHPESTHNPQPKTKN